MRAGFQYWEFKLAQAEKTLNEYEIERARLLNEIEQNNIVGVSKRAYLGKRTLEAQVRYWKAQVDKIKRAMLKRATDIINWNEKHSFLEKQVSDYHKFISDAEREAKNLTELLQKGVILREEKLEFMLNYPEQIRQYRIAYQENLNALEGHKKIKPKDSLAKAITIKSMVDRKIEADPEVLEALEILKQKGTKIETVIPNLQPDQFVSQELAEDTVDFPMPEDNLPKDSQKVVNIDE